MYRWNHEKNRFLLETRGITFDEITQAICDGLVANDSIHPNQKKYPNQRIMTIIINDYAYLVPYVIDGNDFFFKTIIPSRKALKLYKGE
jgi:uncharacterized DUF497 family protein